MHSLPDQLFDLKIALDKEQSKEAAWQVVDEYFHFMGIESIKEELWLLTKGTITNDLLSQVEKGMNRLDLIFGYEFLILFMDAVKLLHEKWEIKHKNDLQECRS